MSKVGSFLNCIVYIAGDFLLMIIPEAVNVLRVTPLILLGCEFRYQAHS